MEHCSAVYFKEKKPEEVRELLLVAIFNTYSLVISVVVGPNMFIAVTTKAHQLSRA
jgi:hypothetical protein